MGFFRRFFAQKPPHITAELAHLITRVNQNGDINNPRTPRPLVTLEEFFEGNTDPGSIGYNFYPDQPEPAEFYALFKQIRALPQVLDVRVEISQHDLPTAWPVTDTVWIMTSGTPAEVATWLGERFRADELYTGWTDAVLREPFALPDGIRPIGVWWD